MPGIFDTEEVWRREESGHTLGNLHSDFPILAFPLVMITWIVPILITIVVLSTSYFS